MTTQVDPNRADSHDTVSGQGPHATKPMPAVRLRDESMERLLEHLDKWQQDRIRFSISGNLDDHQYLVSIVKDLTQDMNELYVVTLGILGRLTDVTTATSTDREASDV